MSPLGFYNLGMAYLMAADALAHRHLSKDDDFRLRFEHPIRHLYAHAWELIMKACLFAQGTRPAELKRIGHSLSKAWDLIDKERFSSFDLHSGTRLFPENLDQFHPTRLYAYPETGTRREFTIPYVRAASARFNVPREEVRKLFPV